MRAKDVMTTPAVTVRPDTPLKRVAVAIGLQEATAIAVEDQGRLVGIVTEADLLRLQITAAQGEVLIAPPREGASPGTVAAVMTRDIVAVSEDAEIHDVLRVMVERGLRALPVIVGDRVVGMIGRRDLVRLLARDDATIHDEVEAVLDRIGEEPFSIEVVDGVVTVNRWMSPAEQRRVAALIKTVPGALVVRCKR